MILDPYEKNGGILGGDLACTSQRSHSCKYDREDMGDRWVATYHRCHRSESGAGTLAGAPVRGTVHHAQTAVAC